MSYFDRVSCIFIGIATDKSCLEVALNFHDGHFSLNSQCISFSSDCSFCYVNKCTDFHHQVNKIALAIEDYSTENSLKIVGAGIDSECPYIAALARLIWHRIDAIPFCFPLTDGDAEERADSAARKCSSYFGVDNIPRLGIGYRNEVIIDMKYIRIANLKDYQKTVSQHTWNALTLLSEEIRKRDIKVSFFNATAQGGGVALMRHSLLRLLKLLKIKACWYVPKPSPHVFRITKNNHNLLQGIAESNATLSDEDLADWERWIEVNSDRYWRDGPLKWSSIIILDDPQVCPMVKQIKQVNKNCKIIYRSHIEIASDLTEKQGSSQYKLWNHINGYISQADLFISHPVDYFVPKTVDKKKVLFLPASTDPLDGLNKHLNEQNSLYWLSYFNYCAASQSSSKLKFPSRSYITQIARFDPSKGIPDVLESYYLLRRRMLTENFSKEETPQLVLCGHGSVDDPDGTIIYQMALEIIKDEKFEAIRCDISIVRAPPEDRILNAVLSCAKVCLQLSHREGFEVKITEALRKGVPVVAYEVGGIPLQLPSNYKYLVPAGQVDKVADNLYELLTDKSIYQKTSNLVQQWGNREEYFTVFQTLNWMWIIYRELVLEQEQENLLCDKQMNINETGGRYKYVKTEWKEWYRKISKVSDIHWGDEKPEE